MVGPYHDSASKDRSASQSLAACASTVLPHRAASVGLPRAVSQDSQIRREGIGSQCCFGAWRAQRLAAQAGQFANVCSSKASPTHSSTHWVARALIVRRVLVSGRSLFERANSITPIGAQGRARGGFATTGGHRPPVGGRAGRGLGLRASPPCRGPAR